jgi:hypothetical protein
VYLTACIPPDFASLPTFRLYKMISAIDRAQIMWRVLLYILHITLTCETSSFCHSEDEDFALLCCYAAHVASCLLMFKDSLSSRKKHAHIDKYICKGVMHNCTLPDSQSVVETCSLVIEILVVTPVMQLSTIPQPMQYKYHCLFSPSPHTTTHDNFQG